MNRVVFVTVILLLIASCTSNTIYKKPENLVPKDSMLSLLTDMHIASSAKPVKNKNLQRDINYMALIYEKYKIDSIRFNESNTYYTSRIEEYNDMLKEVKKRLEVQRDTFDNRIKLRDSLEKIEKTKLREKRLDSLRKVYEDKLKSEELDSLEKDKNKLLLKQVEDSLESIDKNKLKIKQQDSLKKLGKDKLKLEQLDSLK